MAVYEGRLTTSPLPLVLQRMAEKEETGILTIQGQSDIVAVSFLAGAIVAADALNQTVEDGLGRVLVGRGLITQEEFDAVAAEYQGGSGGTLGDLLVRRGVVSRSQLLGGLRQQTFLLLKELMDWDSGEFKFYPGDEVSHEDGMEAITVQDVLIGSIADAESDPHLDVSAGADTAAEPAPADDVDLDQIYRSRPTDRPVEVVADDQVGVLGDIPIDVAGGGGRAGGDDRGGDDRGGGDDVLWLTPEQMRLWQAAGGVSTARTIAAGMNPRRARQALQRLLQLGLIEPVTTASATTHQVGTTEIFRPPDPERAARRQQVRTDLHKALVRWSGPALAIAATLAMLSVLATWPSAVLLPLPWQQDQRGALERQLRRSLYQQIERASRTAYLMENRFPNSLIDLVDRRLLNRRALRDPAGTRVEYRGGEQIFVLSLPGTGAPGTGPPEEGAETESRHAVTVGDADFLLEPGSEEEESGVAPLYLID